MEKNKVKVTIAGVDYALTTEETPEYTTMLAAEIDEKMKELRAANPFISTNQAAVLIALDYANSAKKAEQSADNLRAQIKDYLEDASQSKSERDFYKREIDRLKTEQKAGAAQINLFSSENDKARDIGSRRQLRSINCRGKKRSGRRVFRHRQL